MLLGGLSVYGSTCLSIWQIFMRLANQGPHFFCHSDDHQILKWDFKSGEATQVRLSGTHLRDCHTQDFPLSISRLSSFLRRRMPQTSTGFLLVSAPRRPQTSLTCLYWHALTVSLESWEVMWLVWGHVTCVRDHVTCMRDHVTCMRDHVTCLRGHVTCMRGNV